MLGYLIDFLIVLIAISSVVFAIIYKKSNKTCHGGSCENCKNKDCNKR